MTWTQRMKLLGTTALSAPDGVGAGGAEGAAGDDGGENPPPPGYAGNDAPAPRAPAEPNPLPPSQEAVSETPTRPEALPEAFWDRETNSIRIDSFIKSYNDTKKLVGEKEDVMKARLTEEIRVELKPTDLPESPDKYELEGELGSAIAGDDPMLSAFRKAAHEAQLPPSAFNSIVKAVFEANPPPDAAAEKAALGEHAEVRIQRVSNMVDKHLTDPGMKSLAEQVATTAAGVQMLETLLGVRADADRVGSDNSGQNAVVAKTKSEIQNMMADPRYQPGPSQDPAFVARVQDAWKGYHSANSAS